MAKIHELTYSNILASSVCLAATRTVAANSGDMPAGTVLGQLTASKKYKAYSSGADDGSQNAKAILLQEVEGGSEDVKAPVLLSGLVRRDGLAGLDAASETALAACGIHMDTENLA